MKTGSGTVNRERALWIVGELERGKEHFVIASRVRSATRPLSNTAAIDLAARMLNQSLNK